jgi:hypothetical protein
MFNLVFKIIGSSSFGTSDAIANELTRIKVDHVLYEASLLFYPLLFFMTSTYSAKEYPSYVPVFEGELKHNTLTLQTKSGGKGFHNLVTVLL